MDRLAPTFPTGIEDPSEVHLETYRVLCLLAGILNLVFGVIYHFTNPEAVDPIWVRFGVTVAALILPLLSYYSSWVQDYFIALVQGIFYIMTAYFVGVTVLNDFSPDYALGALFGITGIGFSFSLGRQQIRPLMQYLVIATLMYIGAAFIHESPQTSPALVGVTAFSTALIIFVVAHGKRQAEQLAIQTAQRNQTLERYQALINAANIPIFIANPESERLVEANEKAKSLTGYTEEEIRRLTLTDLYPSDKREHYATLFDQHMRGETTEAENLHLVDKNGTHIPVDVSASVIDVEGDRFIQAIFRDITERQRYEEQLIEAKEQAEKLLKLKSSFVNNMSHELRTPLTSILGYAEALQDELDDMQREFAEYIVDSAKRLKDTLNSVLDVARLDSGEASLDLEVIDLAEEVENVVELLRPVAEKRGLELNITLPAQPAYAEVDIACVNHITNNLVSNALKFTEEGYVNVEVADEDETVVLRVEDTGIGISEQFKDQLFEEFRQESTGLERTYEGSGLGLAITKRLVDLMGGSIDVESEKGVGSIFTVSLPSATSRRTQSDSASHEDLSLESFGFEGNVLVVEDNTLTQQLITHQLGETCHVETASRPEEALEIARKRSFDLLLLDIHLRSEKNGIDVLHDLRTLPSCQDAPALALTAYAMPDDRERFLEAGFDRYLSKPFTQEQLVRTMRQALQALQ